MTGGFQTFKKKGGERKVSKAVTVAEYTCYDLMHVFHDTLITVIKIKDLAQPDKQEDKTTMKVLPPRFSSFPQFTRQLLHIINICQQK